MSLFKKKQTEDSKKKSDKKPDQVVSEKKTETGQSMKDLYSEEKSVKSVKKDDKIEQKSLEKKVEKKRKYGDAYKILIKPLITEKASSLGVNNKYVFEVAGEANKIEVAKSIEEVYGINPISVNIIKMRGKVVRRGRITGKTKKWKKAIVTLPKGKSIQVYEGV